MAKSVSGDVGGATASITVPEGADTFDVPRDMETMARTTLAAIAAKPTGKDNAPEINTLRNQAVLLDPRVVGKNSQLVLYQFSVFGGVGVGGDCEANRLRAISPGGSHYKPNTRITDDGWIQRTDHDNSSADIKQDIIREDEPQYAVLNISPARYKFKAIPAPPAPTAAQLQAQFPDATPAEVNAAVLRFSASGFSAGTPVSDEKLGAIAEDVAVQFPIALERGESGKVETYDDRAIIMALLSVVKDMNKRLSVLETAAGKTPPTIPAPKPGGYTFTATHP